MSHALRHNARRDENEAEIVNWLESMGCIVEQLPGGNGRPDLLVGRAGTTWLMEIKSPTGKLNAKQQKWHDKWRGAPVHVVTNPTEALLVVEGKG